MTTTDPLAGVQLCVRRSNGVRLVVARAARTRRCCPRRPRSRATCGRRGARRDGATASGRRPVPFLARAASPALLEGLEDPLSIGLRHPDAGVGDGEVSTSASACAARTCHRAAVAGELDRVGDQVEHDLLEPELVGVRPRSRRRRRRPPRSMPWATARSRSIDTAASSSERRSKDEYSSSIRPASTFDRSRISLSSSSRCLPEPWMSRRYSSWRSLMSPNIRSSSTSENPRTALSGVRSSWDMLARNSDLCRLASSSSALWSLSSR